MSNRNVCKDVEIKLDNYGIENKECDSNTSNDYFLRVVFFSNLQALRKFQNIEFN